MMREMIKSKHFKWILWSAILLLSGSFLGMTTIKQADYNGKYNAMLVGLLIVFLTGIIYCFLNIKQRIIGMIFYFCIFLFLISRIFVPAIQGREWWWSYSIWANKVAIYCIAYSIISIAAGMLIFEILQNIKFKKKKAAKIKRKSINIKTLQIVVRLILGVCMLCFFACEAEKLLFMRGRAYEEYFASFRTSLPFLITFPAGCMRYFLCIHLALKPSKKESTIWLILLVVSAMPMLRIGLRNMFVLNCIFAFIYYFLRDKYGKMQEKKWIGKKEKLLIVCAIPAFIFFMGAYNYIREGKMVQVSGVNLIVDFAYKQGTTYDTVLQGYTYQGELPWHGNRSYTFGGLKDSLAMDTLGRRIFKNETLGTGNSLRMALDSNSSAHAISYVVLQENYIRGEGRGTSYLIENYLDGHYTGVICFSIFLGIICAFVVWGFEKHWIVSTISLSITTSLFFVPRAESFSFLTFIISYKFWLCILGGYIAYKIFEIGITKVPLFQKYYKRLTNIS